MMTPDELDELLRQRTLFELALRCIERIISDLSFNDSQRKTLIAYIMTVLKSNLQTYQKGEVIKNIMTVLKRSDLRVNQKGHEIKRIMESWNLL